MEMDIDCRAVIRRHLTGQRGGSHARPRQPGTYTQAELARAAGLPRSTLAAYLSGTDSGFSTVNALLHAIGYRLVAVPMTHDGGDVPI